MLVLEVSMLALQLESSLAIDHAGESAGLTRRYRQESVPACWLSGVALRCGEFPDGVTLHLKQKVKK